MICWTVMFLIVGVVAFGFELSGTAETAASLARILVWVFAGTFSAALVWGLARRPEASERL